MNQKLLSLISMFMLIGTTIYGQTISGVVTAKQDGQPMTGVSISIKGTTSGTTTNDQGRYTIKASSKNTLVFSFIGFKTKEVLVGNQTAIDVVLEDDATMLDEVVATGFGMSREQRALGFAAVKIKSDALVKAGSPNFASALYGKAPGVRISATPGGATSAVNITVRGINSITGRNQPLIIMDGVPIRDGEVKNNDYWGDQRLRGNGLLDINPEDIDNISILKGASAAALYGSEAVNGVVLITTKSGKGRKGLGVDFNTSYSVDNIAYLPRYQNIRGAGAPLNVNNGGQDAEGFIYYDTNGDGVKDTRGILNFSINFGPKFDGKPTMGWDGVVRPYEAQKDNYAGLFQQGQNSNINVAVSQSTDNSNLRFSLTRQDNQGISLGSKNTKNIANFNSSFKVGNKWTTDVIINYINQYTHNRPYSIDRMMNNFTGMIGRFDNADWYMNKYKTSKGYRFVTGTNQSLTPNENIRYNGFKGDIADYVWRLKEHNLDEYNNRVIASLTNHYQITKGLKLRGRVSTDFTSEKVENRQSTEVPLAFNNSGYFSLGTNLYSIVYGDLLLTYNKKLSQNFNLDLMGGYTATKEIASRLGRETNGGLSTENLFDIAASINTPGSSSGRSSLSKDALLATAHLDFKEYFFVEGTVRRDRTSTMNPNNNTFVYPSVNTSFIFSEAFQLPEVVSFGKLRASWGIVGNYPDIYGANIAYNQNTLGVQAVGGRPVLYTTIPTSFGNDGIRPEQKREFEFGLEAKFLKNRIGLDVSYYNAQIVDQILPLTLPATTGATSVLTNIGTLRNKGIEVGITATPYKTRNFVWQTTLNLAKNTNIVEKLANGATELLHADYDGNAAQLRSVVGQPMGDFYAHPIATNANGEKIVNPDGLYKVDPDKMVKIGNAMPKVVGGFINSFSYKGFSLDVITDFRFGGYIMPTGINWMISRGLLEESTKYMDAASGGLSYYMSNGKGIQTTGDKGPNGETVYHDGMLMEGVTDKGEKNTNVVSQAYYYWNTYNWGGPQYSSSRYELYIQKNSYIKLRELSFGYSLPATLANKIGAKKLNVSVFGRNLLYFYRTLKDLDAEQTTAGSRWFQTLSNAGTNPSTRTMGIMLRASF
ncbi:TonB-dependent receptor plug [Emticicia oligotrophica DSM 17448]|uniref:TonB-dependent receptor plug n=1 Tax=Emticicia oligotrophica (strain DSM 17448 / CIP 109782 / MTCC 6937 / GPTSA100-15) TaxID=929562 RepID=A0ABM5N2L8_EMTOG|nr:SusC/RagA family TonB-linked outer membrane protein [Emticicia oligotrophica]AFK03697.1 TonB-dependent receptor plug [Emticicia oligotrophica DSM 17448]